MNTNLAFCVAALAGILLTAQARSAVAAEPSDAMKQKVAAALDHQVESNADVKRTLDEVMTRVKSPEWAAEQARLRREIQVLTGVAPILEGNGEDEWRETEDRMVVFVSSSMPLQTLRNYARDLERINGLMVLRGMVDGMQTMGPTLTLISRVLRVDAACEGGHCRMRKTNVVIDPILFRENGIIAVPATVFVEGMPLQPYCERFEVDSLPRDARYIVYGDVSVRQLASELYRLSKNTRLEPLVKAL